MEQDWSRKPWIMMSGKCWYSDLQCQVDDVRCSGWCVQQDSSTTSSFHHSSVTVLSSHGAPLNALQTGGTGVSVETLVKLLSAPFRNREPGILVSCHHPPALSHLAISPARSPVITQLWPPHISTDPSSVGDCQSCLMFILWSRSEERQNKFVKILFWREVKVRRMFSSHSVWSIQYLQSDPATLNAESRY